MASLKQRLIPGLLQLIARLPLRWSHRLGRVLGWFLWHSNSRARLTTEINLALCYPQQDQAWRQQLARRSLCHLGMTMMEAGAAWFWSQQQMLDAITAVEGREHLQQAMQGDNGVILLLPHLGNWEWLNPYMVQFATITALYQPPRSPELEQLIVESRCRFGISLEPTSVKGVKGLLRRLRQNEVVVILPDQEPDPSGGKYAPLFGQQAMTMTLVHNLAQRTGAALVSAYVRREPDRSEFTVVFKPADPLIGGADIEQSLAGLNRSVEQCVADCPEQYQWEYKRFSYTPAGRRRYKPQDLQQ